MKRKEKIVNNVSLQMEKVLFCVWPVLLCCAFVAAVKPIHTKVQEQLQ